MAWLYNFFHYIAFGKEGYVFEIAVCEMLFALGSKPRKWPWLTIPAALAVHLLFGLLVPYFNRVTLVIFVLSILLQFGVLKLSIHRVIFNSVAAYATQNLAINLYMVLNVLTKCTGWTDLGIKFGTNIVIYTACYFLFAKKGQRGELHIKYLYLYVMSFITVFITNVLGWYLVKAVGVHFESQLTLAICCVVALMLQYTVFHKAIADHDGAILEQLLYMEQKQHRISQENIEIINYKCHDLKKQIFALKEMFGDEAAAKIFGEAERAVQIYDSSVDTGNRNLDLVINEEKLLCDKHGIRLELMADGSLLNFMVPSDIYSLFGNALRNAVESVMNEEPQLRFVKLNIHENKNGYIVIEVTNPCTRDVQFQDGKPLTNKADVRFHGYGIRSMEHIVSKYGGNMVLQNEGNAFLVKIIFKAPN